LATVVAVVELVLVPVSLAKPASSAIERGPLAQASAERPACFPEIDSAMSVWSGRVLSVGSVFVDPNFQVYRVALVFGSAVLVSFGQALRVGWVFADRDFRACPVAPVFGSAVLASFGQVLWVGSVFAGPDFQVCLCPVALELDLASVSSGWVLPVGSVCRAWTAVVLGGDHLADFQDGWAPAGSPDGLEAYSAVDDSPNCRGSLAGWPTRSGVADTRGVADDKDSTNRPNNRGCNKRGALPSSIPIHPSPKADYQPAAPQSRFPPRN
jgi:hypothetical protein